MYLTIREVCTKLNISRPTFDHWRHNHGLPVEQIGTLRRYRIDATALEQWWRTFEPPKPTGRPRGRKA